MVQRDLHNQPFDESTLVKLGIFEDYAEVWLPTFIMGGFSLVYIFDFFSGPGFDITGVPGSPIRLLRTIKKHIGNIFQKQAKVIVHLNELDPKKYLLLEKACDEFLIANPDVARAIDLHLHNEDFDSLFPKLLPLIKANPSLVFLDQNGIRFLSPKYLMEFEKMKQTDFLCFFSASYLWRFGGTEEFKRHLDLDIGQIKSEPYQSVHRSVVSQLRAKLKTGTKLRLYPFSLQKGSNIYGLIFGATFPLAVEKFLDIAWTLNGVNGEANFDIDDDAAKRQRNLFEPNLTKVEAFKELLRRKVLNNEIRNNAEAYAFSHSEGHPGRHASEILVKMKKDKEVAFDGKSPLINYRQIYKNRRNVKFTVLEIKK